MSGIETSRKRYAAFRRLLREQGPAAVTRGHFAPPMDPAAPLPKVDPARRRRYVRQYAAWLKPHWRGLALLFLLGQLVHAAGVLRPIIAKLMVDSAILATGLAWAERLQRLNFGGLAIVATAIVAQAMDAWRQYGMTVVSAKLQQQIRQRLFNRLIRLSLFDLSEMKVGGMTSRLSGDVDATSGLMQQAVMSPADATFQVATVLVVILVLNWQLALAICAIVCTLVLLHLLYVRRIRPVYRSMRDDRALIDGRLTETLSGIRVVRAFRREPTEGRTYAVGHHAVIRKSVFAHVMELAVRSGWGLMFPTVTVVLYWYGGYLVMQEKASMGDLIAFQGYIFQLIQPIMRIVDSMTQTQRSLAAMERVFDLLDKSEDKPDPPDAQPGPRRVRELRFEHVFFAYRPERTVIHDFHLTVPGGSVVALVGASGAGKTTLTDLVARFHDPTAGAIYLNGIDLRRLRLRDYRSLLAIVQQETFLFDGTVRDNIAYGRRHATDAAVIDAAIRANSHQFITEMPKGYDTIIGERGVKLSGGQRQRLSIARAILADPQILILDEATSNLDTHSEQLIQASIAELLAHRTTFVIAHRLSTVTHADMIVVLDQGRMVEVGTHVELMARGGAYYDMVERQRQFAVPETRERPASRAEANGEEPAEQAEFPADLT